MKLVRVDDLLKMLEAIKKEQGNLPVAVERTDKIGSFYALKNVTVRIGVNTAGKPGLPYVALY